jgi:4'-phosphopantetheinyl transferase EntD
MEAASHFSETHGARLISRILPSAVVSFETRGDDPRAALFPEEAVQFGKAVEARIKEFATARSCARSALATLGFPPAPIVRGPKGEPLWPSGVVGSITHCVGYRAAVAARESDLLSLGIDAEIHERLPGEILERVCLRSEIDWIQSAPAGACWDRVLFSMKESVYKAWFPLTHRWLSFEDVEVTIDAENETFQAKLLIDFPSIGGRALTGFAGRFLVHDGLILTATAVYPGKHSTGSQIDSPIGLLTRSRDLLIARLPGRQRRRPNLASR